MAYTFTTKTQSVAYFIGLVAVIILSITIFNLSKRVKALEVKQNTAAVVVVPTVEPTASPSATVAPTVPVKKTFVPAKTVAPVK